jgi:hypothetical protein
MLRCLALAFAAMLCGCATGHQVTLNHYRWSPEEFQITFPSAGWRFITSLTSNGEHHEFYECRSLFSCGGSGQVGVSSYLPTHSGAGPARPEAVFKNVTNFLSQSYSLSVIVVESTDDAITWEWSGVSKSKAASQSGVEKVVRGESGTYRLRYVSGSVALTPSQRRIWIPIIQHAKLSRRAA